jgi:cytidylate kinase
MSRHPGVRVGPFEIRPAADLQGFLDASMHRRAARKP